MLCFPDPLTPERFLQEYWQQRPLVLRQALPAFDCGLTGNELAGLACEAQVESRLVLEHGGTLPWELRHGPFEEAAFSRLPASHWTLLVQDVDKHVPAVAQLLEQFRFIPDWRLDDVMVSYAVDQGSVGPHVDDYDVFLFQAWGKRRWQIQHRAVSQANFIPDLELRILAEFEAQQEWLLEPGDLLYLPPQLAHWGVAQGPCMTCSVGFRAPTHEELVAAWCDEILAARVGHERYRDPPAGPQIDSAEISQQALNTIHQLLARYLRQDEEQQRRWFGRYITEPKAHLEIEPAVQPLEPEAFRNRYRTLGLLYRDGYSRLAFSRGTAGSVSLFANGQEYLLASQAADFLPVITRYRELHFGYLEEWLRQPDYLCLLCELYNAGHFKFAED
jgi:50S ribosomal protein L16 3-hydroxylase